MQDLTVDLAAGISTLSGCASPENMERLPELPAAEERRLRRAAHVLQQRLVLRQWLATHKLQHAYSKLLSLDVSSLEDVYWLEDSTARHVIDPKDFNAWCSARQSLPTGKEALQTLKLDLWSAVVKSSKHQDAWTWGGMLVVSISVCGLVTLAAMTQPALAPEAKHSLLQYVTGKYLHPPSCKVEWGWEEPQPVGETMCFTVYCFQRNGQPYPICDTDELVVNISHGTRKITAVVELGSGDPAKANIARVKFTVRTAGVYIINILIGLGGFMYESNSQGSRQGFTIEISPIGEPVDPELSAAASFEYDAVNQRVSVALCFPRAGVFRAAIYYDRVLLHNGEFDCIVLTGDCTATVATWLQYAANEKSIEAFLYFEQDDPELYLSKIKYILETDLDASDSIPEIYFADDVYDSSGRLVETKDLVPNGSTIRFSGASLPRGKLAPLAEARRGCVAHETRRQVRNDSKLQYLDALAQWRLAARWRAETDAFLRGLTLLVPDNLLAIFDENELEELNPRFQITAAPTFGALPTAHTCFNQLCLPDYDSYEHLVRALLWAINEGGEGFGMI
ncbi:jg6451 [Pararge aegeria aegeria]|uniref:HECT-type E3 ubiquitin transferase n=1 Tax=Pararge aegeria aegeria TaxID=348720 RepID=A0A8S4RQD3_9NEOP|nr:jg6451 [Pararge aegeria aegeria]